MSVWKYIHLFSETGGVEEEMIGTLLELGKVLSLSMKQKPFHSLTRNL